MRSLSLTTKPPPPFPLRTREIAAPRLRTSRANPPAARAIPESIEEAEKTLIVFSISMAIAGLLPMLFIATAFWLGWPAWLATWLQL